MGDSVNVLRLTWSHCMDALTDLADRRLRPIRSAHQRDELLGEATGLAWIAYVSLERDGGAPPYYRWTVARNALRAARCGRRVVRQDSARDVLSPRAQQRHGFKVSRVPCERGETLPRCWQEALTDRGAYGPGDAAVSRLDFAAWLAHLGPQQREAALILAVGTATGEAAHMLGVCASRVSQQRSELLRDWLAFQGCELS